MESNDVMVDIAILFCVIGALSTAYFIMKIFEFIGVRVIRYFVVKKEKVYAEKRLSNTIKGLDLYDDTKYKFDYWLDNFEYWVDEMLEKEVNFEYYDESEFANAEIDSDGQAYSLANTFVGCLIRVKAIDYVAILLSKGIKVDKRECWVARNLEWYEFNMVELLVNNGVKLNLNTDNSSSFKRFKFNFKSGYESYGFFRLKSIAELMKIKGDLDGYKILTEKINNIKV